jgi:hypothetical protein
MRRTNNRGTILLMVVAILTVIALLGTAFLLIARADAKQSRQLGMKAQVDPLATGILRTVQERIRADLPYGSRGPYSDMPDGAATNWYRFVDAPERDVDTWLAQSYTSGYLLWNHYTSTQGLASDHIGNPIDPDQPYITHLTDLYLEGAAGMKPFEKAGYDDAAMTDLDRDGPHKYPDKHSTPPSWVGCRDAVVKPVGVTDALTGRPWYRAVRVMDTSALVNLQVAGDRTQLTSPISQANIELVSSLQSGSVEYYTPLNQSRCGAVSPPPLGTLMAKSGIKPLSPESPFRPFGVSDELFLRYYEQYVSSLKAGRIWDMWSNMSEINWGGDPTINASRDARRFHTVWSSSRDVRRNPQNDAGVSGNRRIQLAELAVTGTVGTAARQTLYNRLVAAAGATNDEATRMDVAHFVANSWAHMSPWSVASVPAFEFKPNGPAGAPEAFEVYGVVEQLVITEVYAYYLPKSSADPAAPDDSGYAVAIELFNPTNRSITTNNSYRLKFGANTWNFRNWTIGRGGRAVLWNVGGRFLQSSGTRKVSPTMADHGVNLPGNNAQVPGLMPDQWPFVVVREAARQDGTKVMIPIDSVSPAEIGFPATLPGPAEPVVFRDGMRDDHIGYNNDTAKGRQRATIPVYATLKGASDGVLVKQFGDYKEKVGFTEALFAGEGGSGSIAVGTNAAWPAAAGSGGNPAQWVDVYEGFGIGSYTWTQRGNGTWYTNDEWALPHAVPDSIGGLNDCFVVGPDDRGTDLPHGLLKYRKNPFRGHPDARGAVPAAPGPYPDLPWGVMWQEMVELLPVDPTRSGDIQYGKININTAPFEVIRRLPWPGQTVGWGDDNNPAEMNDGNQLVRSICAYRDQLFGFYRNTSDTNVRLKVNYADRAAATKVTGLRASSNKRCFLTPGEIMIPIAAWVDGYMSSFVGANINTNFHSLNYLVKFRTTYRNVANLLTVNSDTFVVYIRIQLDNPAIHAWDYLAVIDRSNCTTANDSPAVLLFSEVSSHGLLDR